MTLPATRASILFAAADIAQPIVKIAEPSKIVLFLPSRSARNAPVNRDPAKAPARIDAVIPP